LILLTSYYSVRFEKKGENEELEGNHSTASGWSMYVELREAHMWPLFHRKGEKNSAVGFIVRSMDDICMYVQLREVQVCIYQWPLYYRKEWENSVVSLIFYFYNVKCTIWRKRRERARKDRCKRTITLINCNFKWRICQCLQWFFYISGCPAKKAQIFLPVLYNTDSTIPFLEVHSVASKDL
jgi:hypothetical protein